MPRLRHAALVVAPLALVTFVACERKVDPPPMVPEGTGKASASGVQPEIKPVPEPGTPTEEKPKNPEPKPPTPDPKSPSDPK